MSTFDNAMSATRSSSVKQKRTGFSTETSRASGGLSKKTKVGRKKVSAMEKVQFLASKATFIENIRKSNTLRNERSITKHDFRKLFIQFGYKEQSCRPGMVSSVFKQQSNPRLPSREIVEAMKRANSAFCKEPKSLLQGQKGFAIILAKNRDTAIFNRLYIKLYIKFVANNGKNRDSVHSAISFCPWSLGEGRDAQAELTKASSCCWGKADEIEFAHSSEKVTPEFLIRTYLVPDNKM